mmetsp:Transcript_2304/g.5454  ORF Transcript_2304/g.5454 Transcript_2304/m.5454 type:complete len:303 (+) Transcript_2304:356-1264(+)
MAVAKLSKEYSLGITESMEWILYMSRLSMPSSCASATPSGNDGPDPIRMEFVFSKTFMTAALSSRLTPEKSAEAADGPEGFHATLLPSFLLSLGPMVVDEEVEGVKESTEEEDSLLDPGRRLAAYAPAPAMSAMPKKDSSESDSASITDGTSVVATPHAQLAPPPHAHCSTAAGASTMGAAAAGWGAPPMSETANAAAASWAPACFRGSAAMLREAMVLRHEEHAHEPGAWSGEEEAARLVCMAPRAEARGRVDPTWKASAPGTAPATSIIPSAERATVPVVNILWLIGEGCRLSFVFFIPK